MPGRKRSQEQIHSRWQASDYCLGRRQDLRFGNSGRPHGTAHEICNGNMPEIREGLVQKPGLIGAVRCENYPEASTHDG